MSHAFRQTRLSRLAFAFLLCFHHGVARAADSAPTTTSASQPSPEAVALQDMADARTHAELEIRALTKLTKKGAPDVSDEAAASVPGLARVTRAIEREQKKPAAEQDAARLADLAHRADALRSAWQNRLLAVRTESAMIAAEATSAPDSAAALHQLATVESEWKLLRMDLGNIRDAYQSLADHAHGSAERVKAAQAGLHQSNESWEAELTKQTDGLPGRSD